MPKKIFLIIVLFLPLIAWSSNETIHLISVNGLAESTIDSNRVTLQIESWGKMPTAKKAQEIQAKQYTKIKNVFEKYKINSEDYKTENFFVNPEYTYETKLQRNRVTGYRASHQIKIVFKKIDQVGQLIDDLTAAGVGDTNGGVLIQNISWDSDKKSITENLLMDQAVHNARDKAEALAKAAGVKIKAVHHISYTSYTPPIEARAALFSMRQQMTENDNSQSTELSAGKIKIHVEVQMEFEI